MKDLYNRRLIQVIKIVNMIPRKAEHMRLVHGWDVGYKVAAKTSVIQLHTCLVFLYLIKTHFSGAQFQHFEITQSTALRASSPS